MTARFLQSFAGLVCLLIVAAMPVRAEPVVINKTQALLLAKQAYSDGDNALAFSIAERILKIDPEDPAALLLIAATAPELGQARLGRLSGAASFRAARKAKLPLGFRHEAARYTAVAALTEGRAMLADYWLRRAIDSAAVQSARAQSQHDLDFLRNNRKFHAELSLQVEPSSNLNAGSNGASLLIDDSFYVGPISSTGQALSGFRETLNGALIWRLRPKANSRTEIGLAAQASFNQLSADARRAIELDPMLRGDNRLVGSDLNSQSVEISATHMFALPNWKPGTFATARLSAGQEWSGGVGVGPYVAASLQLPLVTGQHADLRGGLQFRVQDSGPATVMTQTVNLMGNVDLTHGTFRYSFGLSQRTKAGDVNGSFDQKFMTIGYSLSQIGPVSFQVDVSASQRDQDIYSLGPFNVTNGRHDKNLAVSVTLGLPDQTIMGLEPNLTLSESQSRSNVSRYDGHETRLGIGFATHF